MTGYYFADFLCAHYISTISYENTVAAGDFVSLTPLLSFSLIFVRPTGQRPVGRHDLSGLWPLRSCSRLSEPVSGPLKGATDWLTKP